MSETDPRLLRLLKAADVAAEERFIIAKGCRWQSFDLVRSPGLQTLRICILLNVLCRSTREMYNAAPSHTRASPCFDSGRRDALRSGESTKGFTDSTVRTPCAAAAHEQP